MTVVCSVLWDTSQRAAFSAWSLLDTVRLVLVAGLQPAGGRRAFTGPWRHVFFRAALINLSRLDKRSYCWGCSRSCLAVLTGRSRSLSRLVWWRGEDWGVRGGWACHLGELQQNNEGHHCGTGSCPLLWVSHWAAPQWAEFNLPGQEWQSQAVWAEARAGLYCGTAFTCIWLDSLKFHRWWCDTEVRLRASSSPSPIPWVPVQSG